MRRQAGTMKKHRVAEYKGDAGGGEARGLDDKPILTELAETEKKTFPIHEISKLKSVLIDMKTFLIHRRGRIDGRLILLCTVLCQQLNVVNMHVRTCLVITASQRILKKSV
jgi:hypothetical protein